jgi:hypothetical protein
LVGRNPHLIVSTGGRPSVRALRRLPRPSPWSFSAPTR